MCIVDVILLNNHTPCFKLRLVLRLILIYIGNRNSGYNYESHVKMKMGWETVYGF